MSTNLFDHFNSTSPSAWKQKIQVDLKGADYNETLLWKTDEGIVVKPFYTKEDSTNTTANLLSLNLTFLNLFILMMKKLQISLLKTA